MNSWFLVKSCGIPRIHLGFRSAPGAVARFSVSPAFEPLLQPLVQRCVEQLGPGEDPWEEAKRGRAGLPSWTSWDENSDGTPESNGTKGCLAKFEGCHIPHFPRKSGNNSPFSARCSIVGGFHMTAQASQLRGLAVDSGYSGWSSRGISLWQAACNVPLWTC